MNLRKTYTDNIKTNNVSLYNPLNKMEDEKTCFGNFDKDNCECIICNVIVECCEYKEEERKQ